MPHTSVHQQWKREGTVCRHVQLCSLVCVSALEQRSWQALFSIISGAPAPQLLILLPLSGVLPHRHSLIRIGHSLFPNGSPVQKELGGTHMTDDGWVKKERMWKKASILKILTLYQNYIIMNTKDTERLTRLVHANPGRIQSTGESTCLSWPAVSQSCSIVRSPSTMSIFIWKSTPEKEYKRTWRTQCK